MCVMTDLSTKKLVLVYRNKIIAYVRDFNEFLIWSKENEN